MGRFPPVQDGVLLMILSSKSEMLLVSTLASLMRLFFGTFTFSLFFLFGDLMAELTHAVLGDEVYLFHEQYVVKAADKKTKFGWHQDSGYVGHYHKPYLSCWCALDDMSAANGTISILPYSRAGMKPDDLFDHELDEETNDKVGYKGDDPGDLVEFPAGSIAVFSSRTFHKSGANTTDKMRRSYLAQYSAEPIMNKEGTAVQNHADPVWQNGVRVTN